LIFTAAHGGFSGLGVPLGGGATISDWLVDEWRRTCDVEIDLIAPSILGASAPSGHDITAFNEREYARFCIEFSRAATERILSADPLQCAVLVNDISEAPDFDRIARAGFRIVTIYHVDVVDYIAAIYCHGLVPAATLARGWELIRPFAARMAPSILRLIFERQRDSLRFSSRVVVPSNRMKEILLRAYPGTPRERIEVVAWGVRKDEAPEEDVKRELESVRREFGLDPGRPAVLCLSRISPEKGQDLFLKGLIELERQGAFRESAPDLLICGAPAFMRGQTHMDLLCSLSARLSRVRVHFPGHVTGARKLAMLRAAWVYAFPSRHESYGLTLAEALAEGLPAVAFRNAGAAEILDGGRGVLVEPGSGGAVRFASEVVELLSDEPRRERFSLSARQWAQTHLFKDAAARIASIVGF
jgi:glycosyltransferase involved in cell wall biosynthesis